MTVLKHKSLFPSPTMY